MTPPRRRSIVPLTLACTAIVCNAARAQEPRVDLVVEAGRPIRVALSETATVKRVGQTVTATVVEPVYAFDRIVIPAGAQVVGRIAAMPQPPKANRARAMIGGDFSPHRELRIEFDSVMRDGVAMPMRTVAANETPHATRQVARTPADEDTGRVARVKQEARGRAAEAVAGIKRRAADAVSTVKEPGRMARLKEWAVERLPYHPQVLRKGTEYDARLLAPLAFGAAAPRPSAPLGSTPAPSSILTARLATALDSAATPRGTRLEAVVSAPVFADDGRLIYPEGTKLAGEVTFTRRARWLHRNGQLRFLFERVEPPEQDSAPLLASLHSIAVSGDDHVVIDEEGGAALTNSKSRFVAPALAMLAMRASMEQGEGRGFETGASGVSARTTAASAGGGHVASRALGGAFGFGLIGVGLAQVSRPLGAAFGIAGAARTLYTNVLGKGREVHFAADTPIQVQLAPARSADQ